MTPAEVDALLLVDSEEEHWEFKEAKNQYDTTKLRKYCVAIANEGGGLLILGVTNPKPRMVVGTAAFPDLVDTREKLLQWLGFRVDLEEIQHQGGRVLVFSVPSRPRGTAYHHEGAYLMRSGESLVPMTEDRLRSIFAEGQTEFLARVALGAVSGSDVVRLLDTQIYFDLLKLPYPPERRGTLARFVREGLLVDRGDCYDITNLGALLFAKSLQEFELLARRAPRVVEYAGIGKEATRSDQIGAKGYVAGFGGLIEYVNAKLPSNEVIGAAFRNTVKMYPEIALRELIANAIIHQDFEQPGWTMIDLHPDRIEISNPGRPTIDTLRFIDDYRPRNEKLADIMRRLGLCEEKGSGIDKVVDAAEVFQLPAPDFRVSSARTTAVLFAHVDFDEMERGDRVRACYQHCCLRYVLNRPMTNASLRDRFKLGEGQHDVISRIIQGAVQAGLVKAADPDSRSRKFARYIPCWA
jgi:predicted HTH transcriptional regulator